MISTQFDDFEVAELTCIGSEADQGADRLPALDAGCPGIDVEEIIKL